MKAFIRPDEKRHFKRFNMTTCDCRLTFLRKLGSLRERENCILVDLSYAGMRFHGLRPIGEGEVLEFLADIRAPWVRSGFLRACVRWVRALARMSVNAESSSWKVVRASWYRMKS